LNEISFARLLARLLQLSESFDMPVQPQLLLLQKNMMMAEGVSRRLDPDLNIWTLAAPLIEAWMLENRGPEARLRGAVDELSTILERLPDLIVNVDAAATDLASGGLRLHPETVEALRAPEAGRGVRWALVIAVAALALAAVAVF
ncbi:MAG: 2-polyprenylphenol 6-hydroxylase, partial [Kiloniellales bacterium]